MKRQLLRLTAISILFMLAYPALKGLDYDGAALGDGLAISGMVLLVIGLFRLVNHMGQFDSARYGFHKLAEIIRTKDYVASKSAFPGLAQYKEEHPYKKKCLPFLAAAALDMAAALLLGLL